MELESQPGIANIVPPFAMTDQELRGILNFAQDNGLDEIAKLVAELRTLRVHHLELTERNNKLMQNHGRLIRTIADLEPDPSKRFAIEMEGMTNATPKS